MGVAGARASHAGARWRGLSGNSQPVPARPADKESEYEGNCSGNPMHRLHHIPALGIKNRVDRIQQLHRKNRPTQQNCRLFILHVRHLLQRRAETRLSRPLRSHMRSQNADTQLHHTMASNPWIQCWPDRTMRSRVRSARTNGCFASGKSA